MTILGQGLSGYGATAAPAGLASRYPQNSALPLQEDGEPGGRVFGPSLSGYRVRTAPTPVPESAPLHVAGHVTSDARARRRLREPSSGSGLSEPRPWDMPSADPAVAILPTAAPLPSAVAPIAADATVSASLLLTSDVSAPESNDQVAPFRDAWPMANEQVGLNYIATAPQPAEHVVEARKTQNRSVAQPQPSGFAPRPSRFSSVAPQAVQMGDDGIHEAQSAGNAVHWHSEDPPGPTVGPRQGTIVLDGFSLGRWMLDHFAREASRPGAGTTSFDPRITASYPGASIGI